MWCIENSNFFAGKNELARFFFQFFSKQIVALSLVAVAVEKRLLADYSGCEVKAFENISRSFKKAAN